MYVKMIEWKDFQMKKLTIMNSFLSQNNDAKDPLNLVSTRTTSEANAEDSRRPKTER